MFKRILVPTDGSELSDRAVAKAIELAKIHGATLVIANVTPIMRVEALSRVLPSQHFISAESDDEAAQANSREILAAAGRLAEQAGVPSETVTTMRDQAYQGIIDLADQEKCDLIVMASHGRRGVAGLLLGSETQKVLTHCKVPVLVCR